MSGKLKQKGETVVEVLICLAIVGFTLSASYALANLSVGQVRDAEERSQSTQLAQQQLERLKAFLAKYPTLKTHPPHNVTPPATPDDPYYPSWILNPADPSLGITYSKERGALGTYIFPGFCIYKDFSIYYTFDSTDPRCAVNQKGEFYCETHTCNQTFPSVFNPAHGAAVDSAGYPFRAGAATIPYALRLFCIDSRPQPPPHPQYTPNCAADDQFIGLAGRYQTGGEGANTKKFSLVGIQYRVHQ